MREEHFSITPRLVIGGGIAAFGVVELLDNFGMFDSRDVPVLGATLILLGVSFWTTGASRIVATVFAALGTWSVLENFGLVTIEVFELWPVAIIAIGLAIFWRSMQGRERPRAERSPPQAGELDGAAVLSDRTVKVDSETSGGSFFSLFSNLTIDLSEAKVRNGAVLHILSIAAATRVIIPEDCVVRSRVLPFMAGYEDKTRSSSEVRQTLTIQGFSMWGAIEVADGPARARRRERS